MTEIDRRDIPVAMMNLFSQRHLAPTVLPALPLAGDMITWRGMGTEGDRNKRIILLDETAAIIALVMKPQLDRHGRQLFGYCEEEES